MRPPSAQSVAEALKAHEPVDIPALPGRRNHLRAGVLVPLQWQDGRLRAALTLRAPTLNQHGGEVSFPGGKPDPTDRDLEHTALREAEEELNIRSPRVLGHLSAMPVYTSDFRLVPTVADIGEQCLVANPQEVAKILWADIGSILAADHLHGIPFEIEGLAWTAPVFELGGAVVFGATALSFYELLALLAPLFGTALPEMRPGKYDWQSVMVANQALFR